jgi:hypothetical protein
MRRLAPPIAAALMALAFAAGCGSTDEGTPAACLRGGPAYVKALEVAPGQVVLAEGVAISDCLTQNQSGGDLATVGGSLVAAATKLNSEARANPGGPAAVELGYLVGAVSRGASDTQGIHTELVRRLAAAARYSPENRPLPPAVLAAYRRGFDAGRSGG